MVAILNSLKWRCRNSVFIGSRYVHATDSQVCLSVCGACGCGACRTCAAASATVLQQLLIFFGHALIAWKSKLSSGQSLSTAEAEYEAEYVCVTHTCKEILWVKHVLKELGVCQKYPVIVNEDNQACISMSKNPVVSGRNKHMEIKMHFVRQCVRNKEIFVQATSNTVETMNHDLQSRNIIGRMLTKQPLDQKQCV